MNTRKGFTRFGVAFVAPYFGFWLWYYGASSRDYNAYVKAAGEALDKGDLNMHDSIMRVAIDAGEGRNTAVVWGIMVPVAVLVVALLAFWVYRGFNPKEHTVSAPKAYEPREPKPLRGWRQRTFGS